MADKEDGNKSADLFRPVGVGAGFIIVENGKTFLAKRKGSHGEGTFGSCGGHLESGETIKECLKREAKEELGIEIEIVKFLCCFNMIKYGKHYMDLEFLAKIKKGEPTIMEPDRIESIGWYPLDKLPSPLFEPLKVALDAYRTGKAFYEVNE